MVVAKLVEVGSSKLGRGGDEVGGSELCVLGVGGYGSWLLKCCGRLCCVKLEDCCIGLVCRMQKINFGGW